jgi:hypothetical protein
MKLKNISLALIIIYVITSSMCILQNTRDTQDSLLYISQLNQRLLLSEERLLECNILLLNHVKIHELKRKLYGLDGDLEEPIPIYPRKKQISN